jgi:hypothetical protein
MTRHLLLVEGVVFPGDEPIMGLVDEGRTEDQGLNHVAFYPTEACLQKMLFCGGFPHVYLVAPMPEHPEYRTGIGTRRTRTMLAASSSPISSNHLLSVPEPKTMIQPWNPRSGAPNKVDQ